MAKVAHIGIVVKNLEEALPCYTDGLGLKLGRIQVLPSQNVRIAFIPLDEGELELIEPLDDKSGVAKFLASRGEGIHHVCLEVGDIHACLNQASCSGIQLIDKEPRPGAAGQVAFLHPKSMHGALVELLQQEQSPE
jgi:methylmalonyl-CoA/ethylmalonyl-CoA epimerase